MGKCVSLIVVIQKHSFVLYSRYLPHELSHSRDGLLKCDMREYKR